MSKGREKVRKSRVRHPGAETSPGPLPAAIRAGGERPGRTRQGAGAPLFGDRDAPGPPPANCPERGRRSSRPGALPYPPPREARPGRRAPRVEPPPREALGRGPQWTPGPAATCRPPVCFRSPREGRAAPHGGGRAGGGRRRPGCSSPRLTWRRPSPPDAVPATGRLRSPPVKEER